jgi:hypothetical protein
MLSPAIGTKQVRISMVARHRDDLVEIEQALLGVDKFEEFVGTPFGNC